MAPTELGCGIPRGGDGRPRGRGPHREQQLRGGGHRRRHRGQVCGEKGNTLWTRVDWDRRGGGLVICRGKKKKKKKKKKKGGGNLS